MPNYHRPLKCSERVRTSSCIRLFETFWTLASEPQPLSPQISPWSRQKVLHLKKLLRREWIPLLTKITVCFYNKSAAINFEPFKMIADFCLLKIRFRSFVQVHTFFISMCEALQASLNALLDRWIPRFPDWNNFKQKFTETLKSTAWMWISVEFSNIKLLLGDLLSFTRNSLDSLDRRIS